MRAAAIVAATLAALVLSTAVLIHDAAKPVRAVPVSQPATWRTDLSAARAEAAASGKDLLIEFTVRDGTSAPDVDRAVYDTPPFLSAASEQFIPVRLSVSTDPSSGSPADVAVISLAQRLEVGRIPALVLADSAGRPYAGVESPASTVEAHVALLRDASARRIARDRLLAGATQLQGTERAACIAKALELTGRFATADEYVHLAREAAALDREDRLGLKSRFAAREAEARVEHVVQTRVYPAVDRADFSGAIAVIDELMTAGRPTAAQSQMLTAFKAELLVSLGRHTDAARTFDAAIQLDANGPTAARIRESRARLLDQ